MMLQFQFNDRVALSSCNRPVSLTGARPAQYTTFPNHAYFGTSMEDKAIQDIAKILEDISG
ncbi:hypothetical protein CDC04_00295 [Pseudomonas aeruginosa]|nr:hypothetical protein CDC04_00295 [Pseudomonas aeruginosa]